MDTPTETDQTPLEQAQAALTRAIADNLYGASITDNQIDMLVKGEYENWREHVERIGGIAAESTPAAVRSLLGGDWLERVLGEHLTIHRVIQGVECQCGVNLTPNSRTPWIEYVRSHAAHQADVIRTAAGTSS